MIENRNRAIKFLLCLYIFLASLNPIFAQVTITGNAKICIGPDAVVYTGKESFSNISIDRFTKNNNRKSQKISRKVVRNEKPKLNKTQNPRNYNKPQVNGRVKFSPLKPAHFFNNKNESICAATQTDHHLKLIGKFPSTELSFYHKISLRKIIEFYDLSYTGRILKITFFIRPPPEPVIYA